MATARGRLTDEHRAAGPGAVGSLAPATDAGETWWRTQGRSESGSSCDARRGGFEMALFGGVW